MAELAINNSVNASTGFSPFYLSYGRNVALPLDHALADLLPCKNPEAATRAARLRTDLARAQAHIAQAQQRQAKYHNQHRRAVTFNVGEQVMLSTEHLRLAGSEKRTPKLTYKYMGPFKIKRVVGPNAYELDIPAQLQFHPVINIDRLKPYHDGSQLFPHRPPPDSRPPPHTTSDGDRGDVFEVERIIGKRGTGRNIEYLVQWLGYPHWESTWESAAAVKGASKLVREYEASAAQRTGPVLKGGRM
jgi:hypothetical protein